MNIKEIRQKYPQYNDLSDQDLAQSLHQKFYSDIPFEDFSKRIGLAPIAPAQPGVPSPAYDIKKTSLLSPPPPTEGLLGTFDPFMPEFGATAPARPTPPPAAAPELVPETVPAAQPKLTFADAAKSPLTDIYVKGATGFATILRSFSDVFGANNAVSQKIRGVEDYLEGLLTAQSKNDSAEIARIMKDAEDKGVAGQVKGALEAFTVAPLDMMAQALGSAVPFVMGSLATALLRGGAMLVTGTGLGLGAASGTGIVKGTIYEETKKALLEAGTPPDQAEARAQLAQAYNGKNLDMILSGAALGGLAATTGIEKALVKPIASQIAKKAATREAMQTAEKGAVRSATEAAVTEAIPEFLQASQEKLAENIALQREGFDVPTMRGVVGAGTLEAITGAGVGAGVGLVTRTPATPEDKIIADLDKSLKDNLGGIGEPERTASTDEFSNLYVQLKSKLQREPTADELERVLDEYEQSPGRTVEDIIGGFEPSVPTPSGGEAVVELTAEPAKVEPSGVGIPSVSVAESGGRKEPTFGALEPTPTPLTRLFAPRADATPQEKTTSQFFQELQKRPDSPITQSLSALDAAIQKAQDAYTDIATKLGVPSSQELMGLSARLPQPIAELLKFPSATGSAVRLVNASKEVASGAKRGSAAKVTSALNQVQNDVAAVDQIITNAYKAAEDPKVQQRIKKLVEQNAISKGVAARQAEIAAVPMEQRAAKIKEIEDEVRSEIPAPTEPTPAIELPEGINDAQFLDAATKLRAGKVMAVPMAQLRPLKQAGLVLADNTLSPEGEALLNDLAAKTKPTDMRPAGETTPGSLEDQIINQGLKAGKLAPAVAEKIARGDLKGALEALAGRLTSPLYKALALRLAELNLPTNIVFNGARDLTRRQIDLKTYNQQKRLFDYVARNYPDVYDKYFKNYDREENLEQVYNGLKALQSGKYKLGPVIAEFTDVTKAFDDNIRGLEVFGAYYPSFDTITVSFENATNDTFLHEVLHSATEAVLRAYEENPESLTEGVRRAAEDINNMYKFAVDNIPFDLYGLTNVHEFISEVYTNKSFQDRLRKIQYTPARVPLMTRLVRAIFRIIGIDNLAGSAMAAATQLFSAVRTKTPVSSAPRFAKGKRVKGPISKPGTWRTAEEAGVNLTKELQDAITGRQPWSSMLPEILPAMWDAGTTYFRRGVLGFANLRQIDDLTKTKFPQISGAIRIIEQMIADRNRTMTKAKDILQVWTKAQANNLGQSRLMGRIMLEATLRGIDPDTAAAGTLNPELEKAWNALKPEFKQIYRQVRDFYEASINEMIREMKTRAMQLPKAERQKVIKEINAKFGPDKLVKPYFPLRRFGKYWFQVGKGNFKEFYEFETPLARELAFRKRRRQLSAGNAQQKALVESMRKGNGISELYSQNVSSTQVLKDAQDLVDNVTSTNVTDVKRELKESLDQLIYILLPQQSVRKMFINRQGIQGASEDMLRVFATTAVHSAYQQSRFKYAEKFINNLTTARQYVSELPNSEVYADYIQEVENRAKTILSNEDTSMAAVVAGKASDATFYFMLSAPFSAMLNLLGAAAITMPYIGGRYGYTKANAVLLKNLGRYTATLPKRSIAPALRGQFLQMEFPSIVEGGKLTGVLKRAADRFVQDNDINISQTNDIMDIGGRPSELYTGRYNTVKRAIAGLFHQSERLNREVALMSVFELAYDKFLKEPKKDLRGVVQRDSKGNPVPNTPDEAFELAIIEAKDIAGLSLGDFTRQMKPRYFTPPLLSVITKFKQYSVLATYIVARNFYYTFAAPFRKAEIEQFRQQMVADNVPQNIIDQRIAEADAQRRATYKEGRRRLAGILGVTFLLGGAEAMPFFTVGLGTLVKMMANDDDDEFFDWENWFRNYAETELGGYFEDLYKSMGVSEETARKAGRKTGEAVARGPASVVTGGSLAERVSLDPVDLWFRDARFSPDTRQDVMETVVANAGPVVGLMVNWAEAAELMQNGQYQRAFERAAPAIVSKPAASYRLATEDARTKNGVKLADNFSAWELAMQSVGLQPERLAQAQKASIEYTRYEQKVKDKKARILDRLWMERQNSEAFNEAINSLIEFNKKYPDFASKPEDVQQSFQKRAKDQAMAELIGARVQKGQAGRAARMTEYGRE